MPKDDMVRMQHMLDAAREAIAFAHSKTRNDLEADRMLALSLVRLIEIIGEAASKVDRENQERYASIPWASIIAMRNRLIHAYFDIDLDRLWDTIEADIPPLVSELEKILPSNGPSV
jgi:uncharacterized protein with HEPN domain